MPISHPLSGLTIERGEISTETSNNTETHREKTTYKPNPTEVVFRHYGRSVQILTKKKLELYLRKRISLALVEDFASRLKHVGLALANAGAGSVGVFDPEFLHHDPQLPGLVEELERNVLFTAAETGLCALEKESEVVKSKENLVGEGDRDLAKPIPSTKKEEKGKEKGKSKGKGKKNKKGEKSEEKTRNQVEEESKSEERDRDTKDAEEPKPLTPNTTLFPRFSSEITEQNVLSASEKLYEKYSCPEESIYSPALRFELWVQMLSCERNEELRSKFLRSIDLPSLESVSCAIVQDAKRTRTAEFHRLSAKTTVKRNEEKRLNKELYRDENNPVEGEQIISPIEEKAVIPGPGLTLCEDSPTAAELHRRICQGMSLGEKTLARFLQVFCDREKLEYKQGMGDVLAIFLLNLPCEAYENPVDDEFLLNQEYV